MPSTNGDGDNPVLKALEAGLPQLLLGPAGHAISRLVGAAVEIPASWLEEVSQASKDRKEGRTVIMRAVAQKSAEIAAADPSILDRGMNSMLGRAYREQENREAVAKKTIEQLAEDPAPSESAGPSDDWLNVFEDQAAKASSDDLRNLFAQILAGEVRKPGTFSLSTMQLVAVLDRPIAQMMEALAPLVWDGKTVFKIAADEKLNYSELLELEDAGIVTLGSGNLQMEKPISPDGIIGFNQRGIVLIGRFERTGKVGFPAYSITRKARALMEILNAPPDVRASAAAMWKAGATQVQFGHAVAVEGGLFGATNLVDLDRS
ncbi:DUF2806 domain-containing protein [Devosia sp. J2-20]|uniref:DUF2806 domain-containing protein n=1 Tax=Devosia sp. J2-20 TaxID=3026161 RepID=UPI00249CC211|nr:DUF2806 domain-containing protein [Devosia sp. J2-20]WDR00712.1 DUF2806 domain-containing protein [Devosia sp. J2-20]